MGENEPKKPEPKDQPDCARSERGRIDSGGKGGKTIPGCAEHGRESESGKVWRTVRGRKVQLDPKKPLKDQLRTALKGTYERRSNLVKGGFAHRDTVHFDNFTKTGTVYGIDGGCVKIYADGQRYFRQAYGVFKDSECIDDDRVHWDGLARQDRLHVLKSVRALESYARVDWGLLPESVRSVILKYDGASGYGEPISTEIAGTHNPVYEQKPIEDILRRARSEKKE